MSYQGFTKDNGVVPVVKELMGEVSAKVKKMEILFCSLTNIYLRLHLCSYFMKSEKKVFVLTFGVIFQPFLFCLSLLFA